MNKTRPKKISEPLTWDDLADDYPGRARIRPMYQVYQWAVQQTDKYYVDPEEGTLHRILER